MIFFVYGNDEVKECFVDRSEYLPQLAKLAPLFVRGILEIDPNGPDTIVFIKREVYDRCEQLLEKIINTSDRSELINQR